MQSCYNLVVSGSVITYVCVFTCVQLRIGLYWISEITLLLKTINRKHFNVRDTYMTVHDPVFLYPAET